MTTVKSQPQWWAIVCKGGKAHGFKPKTGGIKKYYSAYLAAQLKGQPEEVLKANLKGKAHTDEQIEAVRVKCDDEGCGPHTLIDSIEWSAARVCRRCSTVLQSGDKVGKHFDKCKAHPKDEDQSQIAE